MTWSSFRFYHFSEAIIFLSLRTVSFRQQLRLLRVEKILGKHHLKNYLNEAKVVLHRQLLRFSAIPHWVFVPWLYSCILVWILGSMYWTFFSGTHTHTHPQKNSTEFEYQNVPKAKKKKKNLWLPLQHFLIRLLHSAIYFSDWVSFNLHIMRKVLIIIHHDWFHVQR